MPDTPRPGRTKAALLVELPPALLADLRAFAAARGSTLTAEVTDAVRRHLQYPPPASEPAPLPVKRPRGRPRKPG